MDAGFIGLGAMGAPMARNLARAGHLRAVWNRTETKAHRLAAELSVIPAVSPEDLARRSEIIFLCVSRDEDVLNLVDALGPGLRPGAVVVDCSTVSGATAREAERRIRSHAAEFLDAPISGGVEGARAGTLSMMVGGEVALLTRIRPVLDVLATRCVHLGPVGAGQDCKAVNQVMAAGINLAVCEALAFGEAQGLPMERVVEAVAGGAAGSWFLDRRGQHLLRGLYEPGFKMCLHHKDLCIAQESAHASGVDLMLTRWVAEGYATLLRQGYGDEDISALYRLYRPPPKNL